MKCFKRLDFGHIAANCPTKSTKLATKEQIQIKKNENEKTKESKKSLILLDLTKIIAPSWYTSSFSFSLPKVSTYLPSFLKNFRNDFQTPPKGFHLLRGFHHKYLSFLNILFKLGMYIEPHLMHSQHLRNIS